MQRNFQFNLNNDDLESIESLIARKAPVLDLLQNKALKGEIVRGTLVLMSGSAKPFTFKELLKTHGCKFDAASKTWRRPLATVAEKYAIDVLRAREVTQNTKIIDAILAQVDAADKQRRDFTWAGMPCVPMPQITPEARVHAWARHGLEPPTSFDSPRRNVYGIAIGL